MGDATAKVRLDKWLWAARFYKTRAQAHEAIANGRVFVEGLQAKPSRLVQVGQRIAINTPRGRFDVAVLAVSGKRGSGAAAALLYKETEESKLARESRDEMRRLAHAAAPPERPNTQQRRLLRKIKEG